MPRKSKQQKQRKIKIFHNWANEAMARAIHEVEENAKWGGALVLQADDELKMLKNAKQLASLGISFAKYIFCVASPN
ncbi:hypothetical protein KUTeg_020461 [Tegillarca granosa]|uniref:Uncharacterized protein n=1 Tax=Tegillarca granosa TaxID=220873 RepID=A0ABQ9E7Y6_TEGGR|nr:hypothetical protein KUTeg_020461 [Tegillarca granosa]